jgi:pimeloyl-ACP methyl ester carboxylesterase
MKGKEMQISGRPSITRWFALGLGFPIMICSPLVLWASQLDNEPVSSSKDPASAKIAAVQEEFRFSKSINSHDLCNQEFRFEHAINVGDGVKIHVIERFSGRAVMRQPHRALLMLPATLASNNYFDAEVGDDPSYNALHQAASRGFFGFAMSYEGFGKSTLPDDGLSVTAQRMLEHTGKVLEWIRTHRGVPKVDVLGTSIGAGIAIALGGTESSINHRHVHRIVIITNVYKRFSKETQAVFNPEFKAFLLNLPGGYLTTDRSTYAPIFSGMDASALNWANDNIPGVYPVGPLLEGFDLPFFEAAPGRAPLIQFWGNKSPTTPRSDVEQLQREYGGPHQLVIYDGAAHNPILEPVRHKFWYQVDQFLNQESHDKSYVCE